MKMKQDSNGLNIADRSKNNGEDWYSKQTYFDVIRACDMFWSNTKVSHFENGEAVRTNIPRKKPTNNFFNDYKRTTPHKKGA